MLARKPGICAAAIVLTFCLKIGDAGAATRWHPPQRLTWYWQLTGTPKVEPVDATDIDGFDNSAHTVASFHARGQHVICYIDVGTAENWRPDHSRFPARVLGKPNGWPGERWLDIRQLSILEPIMTARFEMCRRKGLDAVEPDNMDGYENDTGFPLTAGDQLTYDRWIAHEVHSLGMAVFQKNDPDQAATLEADFDGVLDEQCNQYAECSSYRPYLRAGKPVLNAEYKSSLYPRFCSADDAAGIMGALYNVNLDGSTYKPCFGPSSTGPARPRPTRDRAAPRPGVARGPLVSVKGIVRVALTCPPAQSYCAGILQITTVSRFAVTPGHARVPLTLGRAAFLVRGGRKGEVAVRLSRAALRRLGARTVIRVAVAVRAHDAAGRTGSARRNDQLRL